MFVAERPGAIYSFAIDPATNERELFLDLKRTIYSLAFHPNFEKNRYVYVTYILDPNEPEERGTRVSRFQADADNPLHCDPDTEQIIIEWPSGGHNGGCLKFGPDGYLYIGTGDGSGIADELPDRPGRQRFARRHPAHRRGPPGRRASTTASPRTIRSSNVKGARPEIWAYGLRQPWKISFDRKTGDLWGGEVGQDLWESVLRIEKGGNYGWSVTEGTHPFRPERRGADADPEADGRAPALRLSQSLTGGYVYRGKRLPELHRRLHLRRYRHRPHLGLAVRRTRR